MALVEALSEQTSAIDKGDLKRAELIRQWRPSEKSTGPKTETGKAAVSQHAYKGGTWRMLRDLSRTLREQNRRLV